MAKWNIDGASDALVKSPIYRHVKTGGLYMILHEGLEVTGDEAIPSIVYQNDRGDVFIQAKARFEDGRFEEAYCDISDMYTHGFSTPGDSIYEI